MPALRERLAGWRAAGETIALVPTMGNLHDGHLSLAQLASEHADRVVMTIFVNPTQFGVNEDFESYPRTLEQDLAAVRAAGCVDAVFVPANSEIYPNGVESAFAVSVPEIGSELCGANRPGHFDGVATVVLRLINIVQPDILILGKKDYQQYVILKEMVSDLRLPVVVLSGPTQRHEDGLAISSRNRYLNDDERARAHLLRATLESVGRKLMNGRRDYKTIEARAADELQKAGFRTDYVQIRVAEDLSNPNGHHAPKELIVLAAAWLGDARLIDNLSISRYTN